MPLATVDALIDALRGRPILSPDQFAAVETTHAPAHPDTQELARALVQLGWLTVYQAKKLMAGRCDDLVVGPYVILDKLGEGGMGRVYKAVQLNLRRVVALKVVRPQLLQSETALKRFEREVKAAASMNHPNIVRVFVADHVGDRHFLAMEYIAGCDLARLLKNRGRLPVATACSYIRQAALGLQHAHDRGLVHRDIKPSNLLVAADANGEYTGRCAVKILDMGLARPLADEEEPSGGGLTRAGTVIGTPDYMSPEQAKDSREVDHRSDVYSLGCTFYHLLAGEIPFPTGGPVEKLLQHQMDAPRPVQQLRADVPPAVAAIVHSLLAKQPDDRFQSGAALANALDRWCHPAAQSGLNPRPALPAELADPTGASAETHPSDPFNFATPAPTSGSIPAEATSQPAPPLLKPPPTKSRPTPNLSRVLALALVFAACVAVGAMSAWVILSARKKPDRPPQAPPQENPIKSTAGPRGPAGVGETARAGQ